jgi:hypothetical protein
MTAWKRKQVGTCVFFVFSRLRHFLLHARVHAYLFVREIRVYEYAGTSAGGTVRSRIPAHTPRFVTFPQNR